ncbi:hypothetical protein ACMWEF_001573 [Campylobacter jejuni]|nr:hypothetical protein [Campylobacter jejuni]ECP7577837.1 hypothetical protein [Campylobacter jejuni]EEP3556534.1 hypothetical protein [Campylobacter jejuni]EGA8608696.1 hypothetical protein [Campylobacter jejuni]EGA8646416.1 hypothetical protein [Campylobacter jejuni]
MINPQDSANLQKEVMQTADDANKNIDFGKETYKTNAFSEKIPGSFERGFEGIANVVSDSEELKLKSGQFGRKCGEYLKQIAENPMNKVANKAISGALEFKDVVKSYYELMNACNERRMKARLQEGGMDMFLTKTLVNMIEWLLKNFRDDLEDLVKLHTIGKSLNEMQKGQKYTKEAIVNAIEQEIRNNQELSSETKENLLRQMSNENTQNVFYSISKEAMNRTISTVENAGIKNGDWDAKAAEEALKKTEVLTASDCAKGTENAQQNQQTKDKFFNKAYENNYKESKNNITTTEEQEYTFKRHQQ